ncbi:MAG TPA: phospholipase D family protein [Pseudonocardiaceae bacterium]|nr:phospholipase D family protein [Pseudonocardiaceae bacterium]
MIETVDERLGDGLERTVVGHHARRLRKLGWGHVLEPRTGRFAADRPVRDGNLVEVLVDGDSAMPAMAEAIANAQSHVHIAGWHATPTFHVTREPGAPPLRELLASVAKRAPVRVLMWAGPPLPVFEPTRRRAKAARDGFVDGTGVRCVLDSRERTMHCHHEKIVIVDDTVAFVGGMDFTALDGDRHDTSAHRADRPLGWHDVAVRLRGPIVADVAEHFRRRWIEIAGEDLPEPAVAPPAGTTSVQLVRTIPEKTYKFAERGEFTILDAYLRALRSAESLIYLENQFLWSPEVVEVLVDKLQRPPSDRFRLLLVLPKRPSSGADTTKGQLGRLLAADDGAGRLLATTLTAHDGATEVPVYVHAKVGIVDDSWMTIGSANLNEHSLFNDTEVNVVVDDAELIRRTRLLLWAEHLQLPADSIDGDPASAIDTQWRPIAEKQARLGDRPRSHRLTLLPGVSKRTERLNGPLRGLLVDG